MVWHHPGWRQNHHSGQLNPRLTHGVGSSLESEGDNSVGMRSPSLRADTTGTAVHVARRCLGRAVHDWGSTICGFGCIDNLGISETGDRESQIQAPER